jgi:hypothetical protein
LHLSPTERDVAKLADWLELETLYSGEDSLSFEVLRAQITIDGTLAEEWSDEETKWGGIDDESEDLETGIRIELLVTETIAEIDRRDAMLGEAYPFKRRSRVLNVKRDYAKCIPYIFCLLVADRECYSPSDTGATRLFEHLVVEAIAEYMGGRAIRFGSPRDTMASGISDAINELSKLIGDEQIFQYPVNDTDKDLGLDVVGWQDFPDKRISKLEVFVQCATGENWESKRGECNLHLWQSILCCSNERIRGLAIPYVVADEEEWKRSCWDLLFLDRLRISSVIGTKVLVKSKIWIDWCEGRIKEVNKGVINNEQAS